ncbi:hypothetical protein [Gracilimonas sp.]|uniref:hypothetical protein n=1 Tax=Gracilimonas sp. TaxID=1974203 RepID=UPI0032EF55AF
MLPIEANVSVSPSFQIDDTIKVSSFIEVSYSFDPGNSNKQIRRISYWLDDDTLDSQWGESYANLEQSSSLETTRYEDGEHTLHFRLITSSGRGNIADKLGVELIEETYSFPLWFDNAPATSVQINAAQKTEGTLQLTWKQYRRPNFQEYRVYRSTSLRNGDLENTRLVGINSTRENTMIHDPNYIGGKVYYRVDTRLNSNHANDYYGMGSAFVYEDDYPQFSSARIVNDEMIIKWKQCKYPENFAKYDVSKINSSNTWSFENISDTTITVPVPVGGNTATYILRTFAKSNNAFTNIKSDTLQISQ